MFRRFTNFLSNPKKLTLVNLILIAIAIGANALTTAFCVPSFWATIVLIICFWNTIFYSLLNGSTILIYLTSFINGVSISVFIYCVMFLEHINLIGLFLIPIIVGLITFIPHFFILQLIFTNLIRQKNNIARSLFLLGIISCSIPVVQFGRKYHEAVLSIQKSRESNYSVLETNFMTEKICGMYFKYHTQVSEYDGWRPPIHEPALIIGQWLNGRRDPLSPDPDRRMDLTRRIELYKKFFPELPVKMNCSCAFAYSDQYHNDPLFK